VEASRTEKGLAKTAKRLAETEGLTKTGSETYTEAR
jgi:hypothetical protein